MGMDSEEKLEGLSKFIFAAPSWRRSLAIILILGVIIDLASLRSDRLIDFFGTFGYIVPAVFAFLVTKPTVEAFGKRMTWNRSALLAMTCLVFGIIASLSPILFVIRDVFWILFALSLGLIFAIRLIVLVAIADYRISRMLLPALTQSGAGIVAGHFFLGGWPFTIFALVLHVLFGAGIVLFIWLVERPLKRNFRISALNFINAFIAHNTDGSKNLEQFFREIGEEVYIPQVSLFFRRDGEPEVTFTVPNVHPGPMGEIGGGNLPAVLHDALGGNTLVAHGCATHDFNLVSEEEIDKIITAIERSRAGLSFASIASRSIRREVGTVQVLAQHFGDSILLVSTRSPLKTEDLDTMIGLTIMAEGHRKFANVAFVDAHNAMVDITNPVMPASYTAFEYMRACEQAVDACGEAEVYPVEVGFCYQSVPFTREQGFGDLGVHVMVVLAGGQSTAYVLMDGNNMMSGLREEIREHLLTLGLVDECEVMTTDSHVVNTISGKNPIGYRVSKADMMPYIEDAVQSARADCRPAEVAGSTASCEGIVVFGSQRISQLASTVNAMLVFVAPLGLGILLIAFILSFIAYIVLI
jgi:putative membrane protein